MLSCRGLLFAFFWLNGSVQLCHDYSTEMPGSWNAIRRIFVVGTHLAEKSPSRTVGAMKNVTALQRIDGMRRSTPIVASIKLT
jgi:hypothetical protein